MKTTLLLDLDDTLLANDIDQFLPRYLGAFSQFVAPYIDPDRFVAMLLAGTREMVRNQRPDCTLKEVFEEAFYPALELVPAEFQGLAERFYAQVFPTLRELTSPRPEAVQLVEQAVARGYRIVIATNPLFPATAIEQRLAWAGLPVDKYPFELVTSYELFHFVKPEPAYFAEILARLGWPEGPVLTVGDDLQRDIAASRRLGLAAFWIAQDGSTPAQGLEAPTSSGTVGNVLPWLDSVPVESLQPDHTSPQAMLAILKSTPAALDGLCRDLPAELWVKRPQLNEWCLTEILCHLRDVDREVNLLRLQKVIDEDNPFLPGEDTDPWAEKRQYILQDGVQALHQFIVARVKLVRLLESIQPQDWRRPSRHAIFGPTHLAELVDFIAGHDRLHMQQVRRVMDSISSST